MDQRILNDQKNENLELLTRKIEALERKLDSAAKYIHFLEKFIRDLIRDILSFKHSI